MNSGNARGGVDNILFADALTQIRNAERWITTTGNEGCAKSIDAECSRMALRKAAAALAELIEADREYDAASVEWERDRCDETDLRFQAAEVRRAAALSHITGGPQ